jgi:putative ABC transport system substrate-binding protein
MMIQRRIAIAAALATLSATRRSIAQPARKARRIGLLCNELSPEWVRNSLKPLMAELGYEEGRDYVWETRSSQGRPERLDALAAELVALPVDLIIAPLNREILAARIASSRIPILMMYGVLPVETGLVASLARPGSNVTGTTTVEPELMGKVVEVLRAALPGLIRIAVIAETSFPGMPLYVRQFERAAEAMSIKVEQHAAQSADELDAVLAAIARRRPDAIFMSATGPMITHSQRVIDFAIQSRLPMMSSIDMTGRERAALLAYTADFPAMLKRNAWMIDRLFRGAKPADMPVERPARYRLRVNLKTAKAIGLSVPQSLLLRADGVVE